MEGESDVADGDDGAARTPQSSRLHTQQRGATPTPPTPAKDTPIVMVNRVLGDDLREIIAVHEMQIARYWRRVDAIVPIEAFVCPKQPTNDVFLQCYQEAVDTSRTLRSTVRELAAVSQNTALTAEALRNEIMAIPEPPPSPPPPTTTIDVATRTLSQIRVSQDRCELQTIMDRLEKRRVSLLSLSYES